MPPCNIFFFFFFSVYIHYTHALVYVFLEFLFLVHPVNLISVESKRASWVFVAVPSGRFERDTNAFYEGMKMQITHVARVSVITWLLQILFALTNVAHLSFYTLGFIKCKGEKIKWFFVFVKIVEYIFLKWKYRTYRAYYFPFLSWFN